MKRLAAIVFVCIAFAGVARAQGRDWMTTNGDAQRSAWVRSDAKISKDSMQKPGFQFLWKMKLKNPPRQLNSLTPPATLDRLIGYRGFRMLGFVAGSSDNLFAIDTDLGRMEWEKRLNSSAHAGPGALACPGGITTGMARHVLTTIPALAGGGGRGRNTPAKSAVGEPGQGAVTLANVRPNPPGGAGGAGTNPMPVQPRRANPANPPGGQLGAGPFLVFALAGSGMLHSLHMSNGADYEPQMKFLPPGANANGLIVTDQFAYAVTEGGCGDAPNGVWAIDLITKEVKTFKANVAGSVGMAFDGDGVIYVVTGSGGEHPNSLVALDPKTLAVKASYSVGAQEFSSSPVIFAYKDKTLLAATTKNGGVHLFDTANLKAPLFSTPAGAKDFTPGALASWQDESGGRWILAPAIGAQAAEMGFKADNGAITKGAVVAWKVAEQNGAPTLQPGWASRNLVSPLTPTIINGVIFATSSGEFRTNDNKVTAAQRAARSSRAVMYALDGATGKELWNSGATITSFTRGAALSGGMGQIYLTTYEGTIYAFGFPMEH
jgi:outer membrane protein assembly factor BamB